MANRLLRPAAKPSSSRRFDGMRKLAGGRFAMGSEDFYPDEAPVREVEVGSFWIDETPVTNVQFARFVSETGYVTFAERPIDVARYPGMASDLAVGGSIVFTPPDAPVDLNGPPVWWQFVAGACWHRPLGPGSSIEEIANHPVVHVAAIDAAAYARWARKALPTEAEWEYAARGGLEHAAYAWGDEFRPGGVAQAKTWEGEFPWRNTAPHGQERTAPVRSFPANGFGLYDMIGNVWELTDSWYDGTPVVSGCCGGTNPGGDLLDPDLLPAAAIPRRVAKGGSHLCASSYCQRYRPAARWPQPLDTTTSHTGFRCIVRR